MARQFLWPKRPVFPFLSRVARSAMAKIDVRVDDRGLACCLDNANVLPEWKGVFVKQHHITTLDDFVYLVNSKDWEAEVLALVEGVKELKGNRIAGARFRSAWEAGSQALKQATQVQPVEQPDEPLPDNVVSQLSRDFAKKYSITIDTWLEPCDALRSRVYREWKKQTMTVLDIRRVKSVISQAVPKQQDTVTLSGGVSLEIDKEVTVDIKTAVEYYWKLRVLCNAWAWAGTFLVPNEDKKMVPMMTLESALNYADTALYDCFTYGSGSLYWFRKNDLATRGQMATGIRRGLSAEAALKEAVRHFHLEWRAPAAQLPPVVEEGSRKRAADPPPAAPSVTEPAKRRAVKGDRFQTVSMIKGGKSLCKPWNDGRGCASKACPNLHACDVRLPSGKGCMSTAHTRMSHPIE